MGEAPHLGKKSLSVGDNTKAESWKSKSESDKEVGME